MRINTILYILIGFVLFSCSEKDEKKKETVSSYQEIYEFSEMALLMEKMYDELEKNRPAIIDGNPIGNYPTEFNKIHTAELTNSFSRTDEFTRLADLYIQNLKAVYAVPVDNPDRKELFNNVVRSCITCHKSDAGCIGPVSKISKLMVP